MDEALVYHDGKNILAISFAEDQNFSHLEKFTISKELGSNLVLSGLMRKWRVWRNDVINVDEKIELDYIDDNYVELDDVVPSTLVSLSVRILLSSKRIAFTLNRESVKLSSKVSKLEFIITKKGDPSQTLHYFEIPISDFIQSGRLIFDYPLDTDDVSVYTKRLFDCYRDYGEDELNYYLPRDHFFDLLPCDGESGLIATIKRNKITFVIKGGVFYDREMKELDIIFTVPNDPTMILATMTFPVRDLVNGITVSVPKIIKKQTFQIWTPYFFHK